MKIIYKGTAVISMQHVIFKVTSELSYLKTNVVK